MKLVLIFLLIFSMISCSAKQDPSSKESTSNKEVDTISGDGNDQVSLTKNIDDSKENITGDRSVATSCKEVENKAERLRTELEASKNNLADVRKKHLVEITNIKNQALSNISTEKTTVKCNKTKLEMLSNDLESKIEVLRSEKSKLIKENNNLKSALAEKKGEIVDPDKLITGNTCEYEVTDENFKIYAKSNGLLLNRVSEEDFYLVKVKDGKYEKVEGATFNIVEMDLNVAHSEEQKKRREEAHKKGIAIDSYYAAMMITIENEESFVKTVETSCSSVINFEVLPDSSK